MGKKLDFSSLEADFLSGNSFELTDSEYQQKIGKPMPTGNRYLKKDSPLAAKAHEYGYKIEIIEEPAIIRKIKFSKRDR